MHKKTFWSSFGYIIGLRRGKAEFIFKRLKSLVTLTFIIKASHFNNRSETVEHRRYNYDETTSDDARSKIHDSAVSSLFSFSPS